MNTEILFRGAIVGTGIWVEGYLAKGIFDPEWVCIFTSERKFIQVIPESVGQFTGLLDKNGTKIFQGDVLKGDNFDKQMLVIWRKDLASFALSAKGWLYDHYFGEAVDARNCEVIGNVFDNPELIGKEAHNA